MSHFFISAAYKSSGKTTVSIGLCAALKTRGLKVQPFKKGPDYIDPMWLQQAAGSPCHNLDFNTMSDIEIRRTFARYSQNHDISVIEGNKGLYDGLDLDGSNSNAALCKLLDSPVVLVIDARGMTRGIAPLVLGYKDFDKNVNIAGIILNKLGGRRHEQKLRAVIEHYTDVPVLGAILRDRELEITERHLGLIPSKESRESDNMVKQIETMVTDQIDLDSLVDIASTTKMPDVEIETPGFQHVKDIKIGVARDMAFNFYYPGDLEALEHAGANLEFFNTMEQQSLPEMDGLFIGGGFPETQMEQLESNTSLRNDIRSKIEKGLPVYAECGGLMYLARSIQWKDRTHEMVGAIKGDIVMHDRPQGRGYVRLRETGNGLWDLGGSNDNDRKEIPAHEFHYSSLENLPQDSKFAYDVLRGHGIDGRQDGIIYRNLQAGFSHLRDVDNNHWAKRFADFVRNSKYNQIVNEFEGGGPVK